MRIRFEKTMGAEGIFRGDTEEGEEPSSVGAGPCRGGGGQPSASARLSEPSERGKGGGDGHYLADAAAHAAAAAASCGAASSPVAAAAGSAWEAIP